MPNTETVLGHQLTGTLFGRMKTESTSEKAEKSTHTPWVGWGIIFGVQVVLLTAMATDLVPYLRGYDEWPPEWRWKLQPAQSPGFLFLAAFVGASTIFLGILLDRRKRRLERAGLFALLVLSVSLWQTSIVLSREEIPANSVSFRTTVYFFEDFFEASRTLVVPMDAFREFDRLKEEENRLRVATHPPGFIYVYALLGELAAASDFIQMLGTSSFRDDPFTDGFNSIEYGTLLLISVFKLASCFPLLLGLYLGISAFPACRSGAGSLTALGALAPGMTMFAFSLDQWALSLSALSMGAFLRSLNKGGRALSLVSAVAMALYSLIAYQFLVIAFAILLVSVFQLRKRPSLSGHLVSSLVFYTFIPVALYASLLLASGFDYWLELFLGLAAHQEGAIHIYRTRWAWYIWNIWDVVFFFGISWWIVAFGRKQLDHLAASLLLALAVTWFMIEVADGVRGETARILCFLYPLFLFSIAPLLCLLRGGTSYLVAGSLLILQTLVFGYSLKVY